VLYFSQLRYIWHLVQFKKDKNDDDPNGNDSNSASRGNWWQGRTILVPRSRGKSSKQTKFLSEAKFSDFIIPTLFSVPAGSLYY